MGEGIAWTVFLGLIGLVIIARRSSKTGSQASQRIRVRAERSTRDAGRQMLRDLHEDH